MVVKPGNTPQQIITKWRFPEVGVPPNHPFIDTHRWIFSFFLPSSYPPYHPYMFSRMLHDFPLETIHPINWVPAFLETIHSGRGGFSTINHYKSILWLPSWLWKPIYQPYIHHHMNHFWKPPNIFDAAHDLRFIPGPRSSQWKAWPCIARAQRRGEGGFWRGHNKHRKMAI